MTSAPESEVQGGEGLDPSTHFLFENKVFKIAGAYFSLTNITKQPVFNVPLGDMRGALSFETLCANFGIPEDSQDYALLRIVERSLGFVKVIRPGESIPRELLDGTASWSVSDRHRLIARARLAMRLMAWISGSTNVGNEALALEDMVDNPEVKARVQAAIDQLAQNMGLPTERRQEVVDKIDAYGHELAYIEALRERYGHVKSIVGNIQLIKKFYPKERLMLEELNQMINLFKEPLTEFETIFREVDAQSVDIAKLMRNFQASVNSAREGRDRLHIGLSDWDDMIRHWEHARPGRSTEIEALLKRTYQFLAQRYMTGRVWSRMN